jgi:sodium pump decarboxylase gamma subunit
MSVMASGLILMAVGMTTVFVFLFMLILLMYGIGWASNRFYPERLAVAEPALPDLAAVAVITAAVHRYMEDRR